MSKDSYLDISSNEKNMKKFPTRISSKVPVQIAMHSRNNSTGYEGHHSNKNEKMYDYDIPLVKPIAINALSKNPKDESLMGSYHSYFSLGQTPSNSSTSSSTTQKTFLNINNSTDYPFKLDDDDFQKNKQDFIDNKMPINPFEYNESVTMALLNSEGYANKTSSRDSSEFEFEKDFRNYSKSYNDKDVIDIKTLKNKDNLKSYTLDNNNSKFKEEKLYKKLVNNEMIFSPDESPIIIPDKPSNNKVDMSKSVLFKNSNSSTDSLSSNSSYSHSGKKRVSLKKARNSLNLSRTRSSSLSRKGSKNDYDDYPIFNLENHHSDVRSMSLPRRSVDVQKIDTTNITNRSRSNTLPRSLIISPAKDEKFFVCTSPKKDFYNIQDIPPVRAMEYERKNNYNSSIDDKGSFVYNQSEIISPSVCDVEEYRNFLKSKNFDVPDASEERKHRSLSRKRESRYRSLSRENEKMEGKRRSRSRSKSKSKGESAKTMDDESRYRSLSRCRKDSRDDERVEKIEKERAERAERMEKEKDYKEGKERRRSSSRHKKSHRKNKPSYDSPLVKNSPLVRSGSRGSGSNMGSPLIKKENRGNNNMGSPLVRKDSRGSNMGSPLVRKESYSSPLATSNLASSKFSTAYIQNDYNQSSPFESRNYLTIDNSLQANKNDYPKVNNSDDDEDNHKNTSNSSFRTIGETKNKDIINEICDLKKFSQDFSSLNILESILNRPIEDDFEFLNYSKGTDSQKTENPKFSTLSRLPSQSKHRSKSRDIKRRNSDIDFSKGHQRASSDQLRDESGSNKGSKRNIFNFFSHKKSKSYSSSADKSLNYEKNKESDFEKMIKSNETIKIKLQPSHKTGSPYISKSIDGYSSDSDSDINNEEYSTSYKNFLKEKMMNKQQNHYNQPIGNIKDYTPLFRINMINNAKNNNSHHHYNNLEFYGAKKDIPSNPYDQFNDYSMEENERRSVNIGNRNSSLSRHSRHGSKRMNY
ncbi:hypothetical protein PIROE2DRAFT_56917 [Piromyces sp. E2]|nr:hypothetical protein PIROE2DRAFT_56917 [Piromyces sp. E2]|eukprot:OUM70238.1 hypothetical protein PIROE2DRAFT_56917 [Piromyces sp. E2]